MIVKNHELKRLDLLEFKLILFYGKNEGLKFEIIENFLNKFKGQVYKYDENEFIGNFDLIFTEMINSSLFDDKKLIILSRITEKIFKYVEEIDKKNTSDVTIILNSGVLEKKSKLRNLFEKSKEYGTTACYPDNEVTIRKIITNELRGFEGLNGININIISDNCNNDRDRLFNEIEKIKTYFYNKKIETHQLENLLNIKNVDDFNNLKDQILIGNKKLINKLLSETYLDSEKYIYYISLINQRLKKLLELKEKIETTRLSATSVIDQLKPPVFWKDKPNLIIQSKKLDPNIISQIFKKTYDLELKIKSNSLVDKTILFKKLLIDIYELSIA